MWGEGGGFMESNDGAGFMSPSQFSSPAVSKETSQKNPIPVAIKTIKESSGDTVLIANKEASIFVIVGSIVNVETSSTKISYTIDDCTDQIQVVRWLESDSSYDDGEHQNLMEKTYCRVVGKLRIQGENKYVMAFSITPVNDMNRLTTHLLEVVYFPLKMKQIDNSMGSNGKSEMGSGGGGVAGNADSSNMQGLSGPAKLVYQLIKMATSEVGTSKSYIEEALAGKVTPPTIENVLEHLSNEGLIFCSIDDEHFKTSENY